MLFGIWVLWISVMAALKSSEITKVAVEPIANFWSQVWKLAASAPSYIPIIPTGKWTMTSAAGIWETFNRQMVGFKNIKLDQADRLWNAFGLPGTEQAKIDSESKKAYNVTERKTEIDSDYAKALQDATLEATSTSALANSDAYIRLLSKALEDAGITDKEVRKWDAIPE